MKDEKKRASGTTDLTTGRPLVRILMFALPLVLGTLFQQLYSFADTVIVGRCLGTEALAAVGSTYSLNFLILGFVQGACVGFGIPVAEASGQKTGMTCTGIFPMGHCCAWCSAWCLPCLPPCLPRRCCS